MKKIFYSWQSDIRMNRGYIQRRLEQAINQSADWEIETATRNTPGAPDIAATILSKIDQCDLFIADVSIINSTSDDDERKSPNPNVMYELGYAVAAKGQDNIILIANEDFTNTARLPFDIRNRRMMLASFNDINKNTIADDLVRIMQNHVTPNSQLIDIPKFELLPDRAGWANWGGNALGSGFRYHLRIDNFEGRQDFINNIQVRAKDELARDWKTIHYKFDELQANEKYRIVENEITDTWVFLTDEPGQTQRLIPNIEYGEPKLYITLRSDGREIILPIEPNMIVHRP